MEMEDTLLLPPSSSSSSASSLISLHLPSKKWGGGEEKKPLFLYQHGKYQTDTDSGNNDTSWATTIGNESDVAGRRSSLHPVTETFPPCGLFCGLHTCIWPPVCALNIKPSRAFLGTSPPWEQSRGAPRGPAHNKSRSPSRLLAASWPPACRHAAAGQQ